MRPELNYADWERLGMQQTFRCLKCGSKNYVGQRACSNCQSKLGTTMQIVMLWLNPIIEVVVLVIKKTPLYYPLVQWSTPVPKSEPEIDYAEWERLGKPVPPPHIVKQRVLLEYSKRYGLRILVETGTLFGDMVEAMRADFDRIYSIELSKYLYKKAMIRFKGVNNIELIHGDSGIELERIMDKLSQPALFWLDGHYSGGVTARGAQDTPIFEELTHIFNSTDIGHVIIIDDARLFGKDPAYPSIQELIKFIKSRRHNMEIVVQDDIIRIQPK